MIRKMMKALCLALVLALALPLTALADTQHVLKIIPGSDMASEEMVKDILDVLSFRLTVGEDKSAALTLTVNDVDVATVALGVDKTGLYVQSNLLSEDVLYTTWDDGFNFLTDMMKSSIQAQASANDAEVDEEAVAALEEMMAQYKKQMTAAIAAAVEKDGAMAVKTPEEVSAMAEEMFKDDPEMAAYIKDIYGKMTLEEGEFTDEARDAATEKYTMTMNGDDLAALCDTVYMRSIMQSTIQRQNPDLTGEELEAEVKRCLEEARRIYKENDIDMTMALYSTNEGQEVVGMEMGMNMAIAEEASGDEEPETMKMAMNMNYDRLTKENGVTHTGDMSVEVNDQSMMRLTFDLLSGRDGTSDGMLAGLANGTQITFLYHGENKGDSRVRSVAVYGREDATAITEPAAAERPVVTFKLTSGEADSALLSDIEKATPDTAVNVTELSADELQALAVDVQNRALQALFTALGQMPASVQQLFAAGVTAQ